MSGRRSENFVNGVDYDWHRSSQLNKAVKQFHDRYDHRGTITLLLCLEVDDVCVTCMHDVNDHYS